MANDNVCRELVRLLLFVKHPDEEEPELPAGHPLEVAVEQAVPQGEPVVGKVMTECTVVIILLQRLEPGVAGFVTTRSESMRIPTSGLT